ncbi:hypothetical protein ACETK8_06550 [Brevundimonas staleyi]|uniref:Uncharacterized protein n=1 Tax=Brevundimonas staleyi TaxID=74326 RepID=A0ABW0FPC3_9CAUL
MLTALIAAAMIQQAEPAFPRSYWVAQQCSAMLTLIGLKRAEPEDGPMRTLGLRASRLADELIPVGRTPEEKAADVAGVRNMLFQTVGRPDSPGFGDRVEALAPQAERCRVMLGG